MTKRITYKALLQVIVGIAVFSTISANSLIASKYPFGLPTRGTSASSMFMGGTSVGIRDAHNVIAANPGNLGLIKTTAFTALLKIDYLRIKRDSQYSDMIDAYPSLVAFSLPIGRAGTLGFGTSKDNIININANSEFSIVDNGKNVNVELGEHTTGGTNSWEVGWGISPFKSLSLGVSLQRIFFKKESTVLREYDEIPLSRDSSATILKTYGLTFGYMGTFKNITAGISYRHIFSGDVKHTSAIYNYDSNGNEVPSPIDATGEVPARGEVQMPGELSAGLSYKINKSLVAAADLSFTLWNTFSDDDNYTGANNIDTKSSTGFSFGLDFIPKPNLLYPKYWETIHYMAGFRYNQLPGNKEFEVAGSGGLALPLKNAGQLEIGFEAGSRVLDTPPAGASEYKENFVSLMIGLSGGKRWRKSSDGTY